MMNWGCDQTIVCIKLVIKKKTTFHFPICYVRVPSDDSSALQCKEPNKACWVQYLSVYCMLPVSDRFEVH